MAGQKAGHGDELWPPREMLGLLVDVVPQPLWVIDHEGFVLFGNPAAAAALGYGGVEELVGMHSHETVHYKRPDGTPYPASQCPLLGPIHTGQTMHSDDEWFVRRDGSMFPISWWSGPIDTPTGRGAVWAFSDITERLAAEKVLRERDAAEIRAAESQAAQRRILESSHLARQQVVRDLHDGAQQRLVSMLLAVQLARQEAGGARAGELLDDAIENARAAIDELRALAAGIHPAILTSRGLEAAVRALTARAAVPVVVTAALPVRLPETVEASAYFLIAEALTNAVKHAGASQVTVAMTHVGSELMVEVRDDGAGGASFEHGGSGLTGMADRVGALGGGLTVDSPAEGGTTVRATFPLPTGA